MPSAKRIATAAITAALLGGTPGLASASTPTTATPSQLSAEWHQFMIHPLGLPAGNLDIDGSGKAITAAPDPGNKHQQWNLSDIGGLPLIKNRATGTCLTAPNDTLDPVTVQACDKNNPNQRWDVHYVTSSQVEISPKAHPSLALTGGAQAGSDKALLRAYAAADNQQWSMRSVT
ncbi:RICIN domain-containing protein [Kitasatospora sp. NPDC056783]|uniref:RICIN domain-containing protein n=1 Tax=Kitasatospora sp. NPDC056783 TaxID=3345943 RepID=UPI0036C040C3